MQMDTYTQKCLIKLINLSNQLKLSLYNMGHLKKVNDNRYVLKLLYSCFILLGKLGYS